MDAFVAIQYDVRVVTVSPAPIVAYVNRFSGF